MINILFGWLTKPWVQLSFLDGFIGFVEVIIIVIVAAILYVWWIDRR